MSMSHRRAAVHAAHARHHWRLIRQPGVTGVGIGLRRKGGVLTDEIVVKVFVAHKRPLEELPAGHLIGPTLMSDLGPAEVDIEQLAAPSVPPVHLPARHSPEAEARLRVPRRPAVGGVSIAHHLFPVGTIALGVRHRATGTHCVLSCNHVLSLLDGSYFGAPVLQPAPIDGGVRPLSDIGGVFGWARIAFDGSENRVDAALASCRAGDARSWVDGIGAVREIGPPLEPGDPVHKVGRTTGLTRGKVISIGTTVHANYRAIGFGYTPALYVDQIVCDLECAYGDSGSLLLDRHNRAVGLLFGAVPGATWCNPFDIVVTDLGIELIGQGDAGRG